METLGSGLRVACGPGWPVALLSPGTGSATRVVQDPKELCLALGAVGTCMGTWGTLRRGAGSGHSVLSAPGLGACGAGVWGVTAWCA